MCVSATTVLEPTLTMATTWSGSVFFHGFRLSVSGGLQVVPKDRHVTEQFRARVAECDATVTIPQDLAVTTRYDKHIIRVEEATIRQGIFDRHKPVL